MSMSQQLELTFRPNWQAELAHLYAEGTEHTMGRVIGVIVRLNLHPDPAQCTAVFIGLRWKNPRIIGHRNVIRDHHDRSILGIAERPSFPACPSHEPRHYSLLGSGLWNTQKVPLPPDFSI